MAGKPGFEPRLTDPESVVLPLNYFPLIQYYYNTFKSFMQNTCSIIQFNITYLYKFSLIYNVTKNTIYILRLL